MLRFWRFVGDWPRCGMKISYFRENTLFFQSLPDAAPLSAIDGDHADKGDDLVITTGPDETVGSFD
jgi:hypothetical protein